MTQQIELTKRQVVTLRTFIQLKASGDRELSMRTMQNATNYASSMIRSMMSSLTDQDLLRFDGVAYQVTERGLQYVLEMKRKGEWV